LRLIRVLAALLLIAAASSAYGSRSAIQADSTVRAADAMVREWVDTERVPGAVLLVSRDGRVVFEQAYGWAQLNEYQDGQYGASAAGEARPAAIRRLRDPQPMTTDTVFDLASVTKVMATTFAVMLLVDAGELDLDATVTSYLPDFRDGEEPAATAQRGAGKQNITLRHLLTHRAGLYQWKPIYYRADNAELAYEYIRDLPLAWPVGSGRHYSDLGFMLLERVVERVAGEPLDAFLHQRLYEPLGLSTTSFRPDTLAATPALPGTTLPTQTFAATSHGNPYEHRMVHDPDFGYRIEGDADAWNGWRRYTLSGEVNDGNAFHAFNGTAGHAGLFSTAGDLQVLLQLLLNRGEYGGRRYISANVVDEFLAPTGDGQALGWQVPDYLPEGSFNHTGFTGTYVAGIPAENVAIVLLTNRQNLGVNDRGQYPDIGELQRSVARAVAGSR
jgi:CubicO group peptidase (beta-lactamase class C family)